MRRLIPILTLTASLVHAELFELTDTVIVHAGQHRGHVACGADDAQ